MALPRILPNLCCINNTGGLCGAVFVDEAFAHLLEAKFGRDAWKKMTPRTRQQLLQSEWEHGIKQAFDGKKRTWTINMPAECISLEALCRGSRITQIQITADEVRAAFDPVINQINAMVTEQISAVTAQSKSGRGPKVSERCGISFPPFESFTMLCRVLLSVD
jgi:hypothetical protein